MIKTTHALKLEYAALLLREPDATKAAFLLYPGDGAYALTIARDWPSDPIVIEEKTRLLSIKNGLEFLPSKVDAAREIWEHAKNCYGDEKTKALKLYAEIMEFISKGPAVTVNTTPAPIPIDDIEKLRKVRNEMLANDDC